MGCTEVSNALEEIFPQVDPRILKAVAIEHTPDAAVEVVLYEVIPYLAERNILPTSFSENEVMVSEDEVQCGVLFNDPSCGQHETFKDANGESLKTFHDAVSGHHGVVEGDGIGASISFEKCDKLSNQVSAAESCQVPYVIRKAEDGATDAFNEKCGSSASCDTISFEICENGGAKHASYQFFDLTGSVNEHDVLEKIDNACHDCTALIQKRMHEEVPLVDDNQMEVNNDAAMLALSNVQTSTLGSPESCEELVIASHVQNFELEKAEDGDSMGAAFNNDFSGEMLENEMDMLNPMVTRSGQICSINLLEDIITEARTNKKTLLSAMESVISLMREVELQEKVAQQVKEEAAREGLDMLRKVGNLKEMMQHTKEENDKHSGEVYGQTAILATEIKELQSRILGLADERDKSLGVLDEMRQTLEVRLAAAASNMKAAEQNRLDKEELARKELADQDLIMERVMQESNILKEEAEANNKLREFLMDRGRVVDELQGEISVMCQDVRLLKEKFDDRVPLSKSLSSSLTSTSLASSSSSLQSIIPVQVSGLAHSLHTPEEVDITSNTEEQQVSGDVVLVNHNKDLVDDEWEIFDELEYA